MDKFYEDLVFSGTFVDLHYFLDDNITPHCFMVVKKAQKVCKLLWSLALLSKKIWSLDLGIVYSFIIDKI